ncbi:MAG: helix-turn-helix domain-containing protein [Anaerovoracaceae bacterium]
MNDVLQRIESLRKDKKINVTRLCKEVGIAQSTYSTWLKDDRVPQPSKINTLADYFGVTTDYLITGKEKEWAPALTEKDEKDLDKKVENLLNAVDSDTGLMLDGEIMDEETREIFAMNLKNALRTTKLAAKAKYTPSKYRK